MNDELDESELTSLTLRLPVALRERIKSRAAAEERSESQFVRFHLKELLEAAEQLKETQTV